MLPIAEISELDDASYVGFIVDDAVTHLVARMAAEGQHNPIWVRRNGNAAKVRHSVIAGRHRLRAAKLLGWTEIAAEVRAGPDSDVPTLKRLQLAENLDRRVLRPIERACFIMERWAEAARALPRSEPTSQQSKAIRARWDVLAETANTQGIDRKAADQATAELTGENERNVRLFRSLYDKIVIALPDLFADINAHPLCTNLEAVKSLAQVPTVEARRNAAVELLSKPDWDNITEVLVAVGQQASPGNRPKGAAHFKIKLELAWQKLGVDDKAEQLIKLAADIPPYKVSEAIAKLQELLP
ncbi:ParB N-terminal domain-containing protein [Novosphingobium sp. NDB2Meth1]|uniref:ParB/RepB/Spo0J family partition protein n=1 Tax=Novosphingobium sp. NDB2Meth1 TaxID=1892847 RepID=UPI000ADECDE9|nr:ParB N-terminal domain-containing protein [Novosphingobium sp. NDB2Meth1]